MNSLTSRLLRGIESSRAWYRLIPPEVRSAVEANVNEKTFPSLVNKKDRGVAGAGLGLGRTEDSELLLLTKYAWAAKLAHFQKYGGFSYSERNQVEILESGDVGFPVMLKAIGRAKERVWLESYIFDDSGIAERFVDALAAAKSRGVREVVVVVDGIGSREMKPEHVARLEATGVKVVVFNPPGVRSVLFGSGVAEASSMQQRPLTQQLHSEHPDNYEYNFLHPWPLRDHRKILICDEVGFCGSLNVMREDCGPELGGIGGFYDVHVKLQGPAVKDLGDVFLDSLAEAGEESFASGLGEIQIARIDGGNHVGDAQDDELSTTDRHGDDKNENDNTSAEKKRKKKLYVQVVRSNMRLRARNRSLQKVLTKSLYGALHSIHITTPYFFPPLFLRRSLWKQLRSVDNGVKMSFLLSGVSDVSPIPYDTLGQKHVIRKLLVEERRRNVESNHPEPEDRLSVYLSEHEHMHAKIVVVDTLFATVGSFNFDWFSGRRNLEVGLCIFDHELAKEFEALHRRKLLENRQSDGGEKQRQEGPAPRAELHTWFGVPLHGGDLPQERETGTAPNKTASPTSSIGSPLSRKTVRRQHLDQWEYSNIFPRAVSFWAYNSVWFASCNIWDGLDHVTALKRRMRAVREEARREREILFDVVRGYVRNGNITSNTTTLSGAHRRNMQMATRMAAEDEAAIRTETERRVRAEERLAFVQMMNGVHIV
eukprot:g18712.t1